MSFVIFSTETMKRFYNLAGILSLSEEEKELINRQVQDGDSVACFKQARIHLYLHECDDYASSAHELFQKASDGGVADADAAIAIMMFKGEIEPYDPTAAARLLEKAINNGSELGVIGAGAYGSVTFKTSSSLENRNGKPFERTGRKAEGPKSERIGQPGRRSFNL